MAQGMQDIKRRIKSVKSTRQITKAMELVSSAKLRKAREAVDRTRPYFNTVVESIQGILSSTKGIKHPYIDKREVKRTAYIVLTADRGLCGGYNSNVTKLAANDIEDKSKAAMITVGRKGRDFFQRRDFDVVKSFTHISEKPTYSDASNVADQALTMYKNKEVDEVKLVYTEFVSTITQNATMIKLLPAENIKETEEAKDGHREAMIDYEPSPEEVLDYLIPKYVQSAIYGALIESAASEQGARRVAMESASDNADDVISTLNLKYNRARQSVITQEISEIVAGANALK